MINMHSIRLFAGLAKSDLDTILSTNCKRSFKASETIITAQRPATHLAVVRKGGVNLATVTADGRRILLRRLVPGDAFGIAAFLSEPLGYLATATAIQNVEVYTWDHRTVRQLAGTYPKLLDNALRIALHYIAEYAQRHMRLVAESAHDRLAYALANLGARAGHVLQSGVEIDIRNQDLASLADVSFFTATRLLKKWECLGALEKRRGKVLLVCPERMLDDSRVPEDEDWAMRRMA